MQLHSTQAERENKSLHVSATRVPAIAKLDDAGPAATLLVVAAEPKKSLSPGAIDGPGAFGGAKAGKSSGRNVLFVATTTGSSKLTAGASDMTSVDESGGEKPSGENELFEVDCATRSS